MLRVDLYVLLLLGVTGGSLVSYSGEDGFQNEQSNCDHSSVALREDSFPIRRVPLWRPVRRGFRMPILNYLMLYTSRVIVVLNCNSSLC